MKTLTNLFGNSSSVKNIADFNHYSLNKVQMSAIKGGVSPVLPGGLTPGQEYQPTDDV